MFLQPPELIFLLNIKWWLNRSLFEISWRQSMSSNVLMCSSLVERISMNNLKYKDLLLIHCWIKQKQSIFSVFYVIEKTSFNIERKREIIIRCRWVIFLYQLSINIGSSLLTENDYNYNCFSTFQTFIFRVQMESSFILQEQSSHITTGQLNTSFCEEILKFESVCFIISQVISSFLC